MNELVTYQSNLPDDIEDIAKFILIGREKAVAMSAEIRAIQKVGFAKAVCDQKQEEKNQLMALILDAEKKMGELTRQIPTAADRPPKGISNSGVTNSDKPIG